MVNDPQNHEEDEGKQTRVDQVTNWPTDGGKQPWRIAVFTVSGQNIEPGERQDYGGFEKGSDGRHELILRGDEPDNGIHMVAQIISQNYRGYKNQEIENKKKITSETP